MQGIRSARFRHGGGARPGLRSMARPGRPGTGEERAVAGRPTPAGADASGAADCKVFWVLNPLKERLSRRVWTRACTACGSVAGFSPVANRCQDASLGHPRARLAGAWTWTCAGVDLRDAGMPSTGRRFRPWSSRRPAYAGEGGRGGACRPVFFDAGERDAAPPGASLAPLPDKHAVRSRNNAAARALFYSV